MKSLSLTKAAVPAWIYRACQNSLQTGELLMIKSFRFANCQLGNSLVLGPGALETGHMPRLPWWEDIVFIAAFLVTQHKIINFNIPGSFKTNNLFLATSVSGPLGLYKNCIRRIGLFQTSSRSLIMILLCILEENWQIVLTIQLNSIEFSINSQEKKGTIEFWH